MRSKEEILRTLDKRGQLDGLPFMPEMFEFCGKRFQVFKRAHKTCDTVFPIRGRRMADAIHLETRCDGSAHGGCEAACLIFWKEAWVKRVDGPVADALHGSTQGCTEQDVWNSVRAPAASGETQLEPTYSCQATQLPYYTTPLVWWDVRQYAEDYASGNATLWQLTKGGVYATYYGISQAGLGLGPAMRWIWDKLHPLWRGTLFPRKVGTIPVGSPTPQRTLDLRVGELVRVKSHEEILKTINIDSKNRGMYWDAEMLPYCGGVYRVAQRVGTIVDEKTGKMLKLKNEAIILEGAYCQGKYSCHRMFCPRALYPYWREAWLERVPEGTPLCNTARPA